MIIMIIYNNNNNKKDILEIIVMKIIIFKPIIDKLFHMQGLKGDVDQDHRKREN